MESPEPNPNRCPFGGLPVFFVPFPLSPKQAVMRVRAVGGSPCLVTGDTAPAFRDTTEA